ncbi:MAG: glucose-6-phosphate dehydrogenase assembly protein OpcA [Verrucomicrobiota bacterium]
MTTAPELPALELGNEVPLRELDKQLKLLWESNEARTKASLANFAIYSESVDALEGNTELIREVTREHACRALLIAALPDAEEVSVRAWITAHCQLAAGGKKSICSEQISFVISGNSPGLVSNTVFSYLDSDLPLTFWWQGPFSGRWEPHLYAHIDRLVIDSGEWADPLPQLCLLEKAWLNAKGDFSVNDLTWTRVLHLRLALAAAFDQPGAAGILRGLEEVSISYGAGNRLAAKMLAAWIMDQTGWNLESGQPSEDVFTVRARDREITFRFSQSDDPRAVSLVKLSGTGGGVTLTHETGSAFINARLTSEGASSEILTPCPCETPAELVTERLRRGCNTPRYFRILRTVRRLLGECRN